MSNSAVLLVESDAMDILLLRRAFKRAGISNPLQIVRDGAEAIAYLSGEGIYAERERYPWPILMLLDLHMPLVDGFEVLRWRQERSFQEFPIIVLSGSMKQGDVQKAMDLGATDFRVKSLNFEGMVLLAQELRSKWLERAPRSNTFTGRNIDG